MYAYNLRNKSTYSSQDFNLKDLTSPVKPDAVRTPGYSVFLALFVDGLPNHRILNRIILSQVLLSIFAILLTFLLFQSILPPAWALAPTLLVALSPHLIVFNSYILTESLFCLMLVLLGYLIAFFAKRPSVYFSIIIGIVIGIASLIRPSLHFFSLTTAFIFIFQYRWKKGLKFSVALMIAFALHFCLGSGGICTR